jgi:hypothetical protein
VDAVIVDFRLGGLGGLEACRRIRTESVQRFAAIMVMAGEGDELDVYRKAIAAGADDLVVKLADPVLIMVRLRALLSRGRREREGRISSVPSLSPSELAPSTPSAPGISGPVSVSSGSGGAVASDVRDRPSRVPPSYRDETGERSSRLPPLRDDGDERASILPPMPSSTREPRTARR